MARLAPKGILITTIGLLMGTAAMAQPDGRQCDLNYGCSLAQGCNQEGLLILGDIADGTVDPACEKQLLIRDGSATPLANYVIRLDFSNCYAGGDIRLCSTQTFPGLTLDCALHTVSAATNASGIVVFRILGYSNVLATNAGPTGAGEGCAVIWADNVPLGSYSVATPDLNGAAPGGDLGVWGSDVVEFCQSRFGGISAYRVRANLARGSGTQTIDGADTVGFLKFRFNGVSRTNDPTPCPP